MVNCIPLSYNNHVVGPPIPHTVLLNYYNLIDSTQQTMSVPEKFAWNPPKEQPSPTEMPTPSNSVFNTTHMQPSCTLISNADGHGIPTYHTTPPTHRLPTDWHPIPESSRRQPNKTTNIPTNQGCINQQPPTSDGINLLLDAAHTQPPSHHLDTSLGRVSTITTTTPRSFIQRKHLTVGNFCEKDTVMVCSNHGCTYAKLVPPKSPCFVELLVIATPSSPKLVVLDQQVAPEGFTKTSSYRNMKLHITSQCQFLNKISRVPKFFTYSNKPGPVKGYNKGNIKTLDRCRPNCIAIACSGCGLAKELPFECMGKLSCTELDGRHVVDEDQECIPEARSPAVKHMRSHIMKCKLRTSNNLPRFYWHLRQYKEQSHSRTNT